MQLYKVVLSCLFGTGKTRRLQKAIIRVGILLFVSISLGCFIAKRLPVIDQFSTIAMVLLCIFIVQFVVGVVLLCAAGVTMPTAYSIIRLLHLLPVSPTALTCLSLMPGVLLGSICMGFLAPMLFHLLQSAGGWLLITCMVIGFIGMLGLIYGPPGQKAIRLPGIVLCTLAIEYLLVRGAFNHPTDQVSMLVCLGIVICLEVCMLTNCRRQLAKNLTYPGSHKKVRWAKASVKLWCLKKIGRSSSLKVSLLTSFAVTAVVAVILFRLRIGDPNIIGSILALCISALMADVRSITKKYLPAEITNLRGCTSFFLCQLKAGAGWSLVVGLPLLIVPYLVGNVSITDLLALIMSPSLLGFCAGLCTSTVVSPGVKDISAQALATLTAVAIYLLPQLSLLVDWSSSHVAFLRLGMAFVLIVLAWLVEYQRNPFRWRKNDVAF